MGVYLRPGANALELAKALRTKMDALATGFPPEIRWQVSYDTTKFVNASIELVLHTFVEAFLLVLVVVYLFLGSLRATIIPLIAIPVSIVGTLAGLLVAGFSINMLTLFGMVLAIGIVVDDAIVVVEAVEKIMHDEHCDARVAARKAMQGIGGAIVGVTAVICAVFVPIAFIDGVTGQFYRQFAVTIAASVLISAFNSLTLSPALQRRLAPDFLDRAEVAVPTDFSVQQRLLDQQRAVLNFLLSDIIATRILDSVPKFDDPTQAFALGEMYGRLTADVWRELDRRASVPSARRDLQRDHVNRLSLAVVRPTGTGRADVRGHLREQARALLVRLDAALKSKNSFDTETRAHMADSADTLRQALAATIVRQAL
jgi:hypothetical protein